MSGRVFLAQEHNAVTTVRLEPATPRSPVKYSNTKIFSPIALLTLYLYGFGGGGGYLSTDVRPEYPPFSSARYMNSQSIYE